MIKNSLFLVFMWFEMNELWKPNELKEEENGMEVSWRRGFGDDYGSLVVGRGKKSVIKFDSQEAPGT